MVAPRTDWTVAMDDRLARIVRMDAQAFQSLAAHMAQAIRVQD